LATPKLKIIHYRGGVVRFRIPAHWLEEYEPEGGGTFYAPGDDTGTLRLNVTTLQAPDEKSWLAIDAQAMLASDALRKGVPIQSLRPGVAMMRYDVSSREGSEDLIIRFWQLVQIVPPRHMRQCIFSYTLLASRKDDRLTRQELDLLDHEIAAAEFAPTVGHISR
jgi:hypothetical protein